jgi:tripartite-type tricarboxylate transporter receptor subunit TctC
MRTRRNVLVATATLAASAGGLLAATAVGLAPSAAEAAGTYPDRPIRLVVPYAAGGGTDAIARAIAQGMVGPLGQQVVVENNGTAGGNVATQQASRAEPDGYTVLMANQGPMAVNPHLFKNVKIDPLTAFDPVTLVAQAPLVVVVPEGSPLASVQRLVEEAKRKPGGLTYGSAGNGSASHLATLLLARTAGLDMVHVPYKGAGPAITDLIGGRLDFMVTTLPSVVGFIESGKAKPLAVTTRERTKRLAEVPTIAESGFADYQAAAWYGFAVPKGTPPEIVARLREATIAAFADPAIRRTLEFEGAEPVLNTPEEFAAFMQGESRRWAELIQSAKLALE